MMKVKIFTETGKNVGLGHLSRCLSVASALHEVNIDVEIIISGEVLSVVPELNQFKFQNLNWLNPNKLNKIITSCECGIFDSYKLNKGLLEIIHQSSIFPV